MSKTRIVAYYLVSILVAQALAQIVVALIPMPPWALILLGASLGFGAVNVATILVFRELH